MNQGKILIVDDDPISRETLLDVLQDLHCDVRESAAGKEALEIAWQWLPDLILLDVMMPGMDGFSVCRTLRDDPRTAEIPILLITALDDQDSRLRGIEAGADDFLTKPFNISELQARVRTIMRLNRYRLLLNERTKFEHVVQQAETGYLIINELDEITFANQAARHYLHLSEEAAPCRFLEAAQNTYRLLLSTAWTTWPEVSGPNHNRLLYRPETKQAPPFWLEVQTLAHLQNSHGDSWVISLTDATEQVRLQQEMRAFHILVQHKLRTPLVSIVAGLQLLKEHGSTLGEEIQAELLTSACQNADLLHLEVERINKYANTMTLMKAKAKGRYPVKKLRALLLRVSLKLSLAPPEMSFEGNWAHCFLPLDAEELEKVFFELLGNARKFHPQQEPQVAVHVISEEEQVRIRVMDNGVTLTPEQLANAWRPYYQGEKYFTGSVMGMGIGLPMVGNIVGRVNGRYQISNRSASSGVIVELSFPTSAAN